VCLFDKQQESVQEIDKTNGAHTQAEVPDVFFLHQGGDRREEYGNLQEYHGKAEGLCMDFAVIPDFLVFFRCLFYLLLFGQYSSSHDWRNHRPGSF